jgi:hypothetical protein
MRTRALISNNTKQCSFPALEQNSSPTPECPLFGTRLAGISTYRVAVVVIGGVTCCPSVRYEIRDIFSGGGFSVQSHLKTLPEKTPRIKNKRTSGMEPASIGERVMDGDLESCWCSETLLSRALWYSAASDG